MEFASKRISEEIAAIEVALFFNQDNPQIEDEERMMELRTRRENRQNLCTALERLNLDSGQFRTALVCADGKPIGIAEEAEGVLGEVGPELDAVLFGASGTSSAPASAAATTAIFSCPNSLAAVPAECLAVQKILGDAARLVPQASVERAPAALAGVTQAHLAGHHDAVLRGECTFAWTKEGRVEMVDQSTLVRLLGKLELVVLNGCKSNALGEALLRAGVRDVLCWSTLTCDVSSRLFAGGFWGKLAQGGSVGGAFEAGIQRVLTATRWNGAHWVQQYAMANPEELDIPRNPDGKTTGRLHDGRYAGGVPLWLRRRQWPAGVSAASPLRPPADMPSGSSCCTGQETWLQKLEDGFFPILRSAGDAPEAEQRMVATRQAVLQPQAVRGLGGLGKTELAVQYARQQLAHGRYQCVFFVLVPDTPEELVRLRADRRETGSAATEREQKLADSLACELLRRMGGALPLAADVRQKMEVEVEHFEDMRSIVHEWMGSHSKWLLILDNADDVSSLEPGTTGFVRRCLPPMEAPGHVLLTSRVGTQDFRAITNPASLLQLELLSAVVVDGVTAAEVLLLRHARGLGHDVHTDVDVSRRVAQLEPSERAAVAWLAGDDGVAGLPLAIQQAGDAIRENEGETFQGYCTLYRAQPIAIFADGPEGNNREAQSVHTTFSISFDRLEKQSPAAAQLLSLCAYLAPNGIPLSMFWDQPLPTMYTERPAETHVRLQTRLARFAPELQSIMVAVNRPDPALRTNRLVREAQKFSLLAYNGEAQTVSMHRMVQQAMQARIEAANGTADAQQRGAKRAAEAVSMLSELLEAAMPWFEDGDACTGEEMKRFQRLQPHVITLRQEGMRLGAAMGDIAALSDKAAKAFVCNGQYKEAWEMQRTVMAAYHTLDAGKATLELMHNKLEFMHNLAAETLMGQGKYAEAEKTLWEVLKVLKAYPAVDASGQDTLVVKATLGVALMHQGKYAEAEAMLREVLAMQLEVLDERHVRTLGTKHNLALVLHEQGKHAEGEKMLQNVLAARREVLGERHLHTLVTMQNLASTMAAQGKLAEAEVMQRQVVEWRREVQGERHTDMLGSKLNLSAFLCERGEYVEAEAMQREVVAAQREVLGAHHPHTLTAMNALEVTLSKQGKHADAEAIKRKVLAVQREVQGERHLDTLTIMHSLALLLFKQGKHAEAEAMQQEVVAVRREVLGAHHPHTLTAMHCLVRTLREQGKAAVKQSLEIAAAERATGVAQFKTGEYAEAAVHFEVAFGQLQQGGTCGLDGGEAAARAELKFVCQLNLAACRLQLEQPYRAMEACDRALDLNEHSAKAWYRRGKACLALGQHEEACKNLTCASQLEPGSRDIRKELEKCKEPPQSLHTTVLQDGCAMRIDESSVSRTRLKQRS